RLRRQPLPALAVAKHLLDAPVLQRMETDNDCPAAWPKAFRQRGQEPVERAQLIVHGDPQCLKNPRCWVNCRPFAARPGHTPAYQIGQLLRCFQRSPPSGLHDLASDPPAITLLAVL